MQNEKMLIQGSGWQERYSNYTPLTHSQFHLQGYDIDFELKAFQYLNSKLLFLDLWDSYWPQEDAISQLTAAWAL